jgi:hypothetical protein
MHHLNNVVELVVVKQDPKSGEVQVVWSSELVKLEMGMELVRDRKENL